MSDRADGGVEARSASFQGSIPAGGPVQALHDAVIEIHMASAHMSYGAPGPVALHVGLTGSEPSVISLTKGPGFHPDRSSKWMMTAYHPTPMLPTVEARPAVAGNLLREQEPRVASKSALAENPDIDRLLDDVTRHLLGHDPGRALQVLCETLLPYRLALDDEAWESRIKSCCLDHSVRAIFHACPLTRRAFDKPRGYAGDAVMLDMIYDQRTPTPLAPDAEALFRVVSRFATGSSVALRRDIMANQIDELASIRPESHILSLACGHLPELQRSVAVHNGTLGRFVAADQDLISLEFLRRSNLPAFVEPVQASVKSIIAGKTLGEFDLIYSGGLYDYLTDSVATALTTRLFTMLRPGGRLVLANFVPDNYGRAYMETFMDWHLTLRTQTQLRESACQIDPAMVARCASFIDPHSTIAYVMIETR